MGPVARAIAAVAGVDTSAIEMSVNMRDAFGFDSLMWVEFASALEGLGPAAIDPEVLSRCETVSDVVRVVGAPPCPRGRICAGR